MPSQSRRDTKATYPALQPIEASRVTQYKEQLLEQ